MAKKSKKPAPRPVSPALRPVQPKVVQTPAAPAGMLPGVTDAPALHAALADAAASVAKDPTIDETGWQLRVACAAVRALLDQPGQELEAERLSRLAIPALADNAALAHLRMVALWRSGNRDATLAEADRILQMKGHPVAARQAIRKWLRMLNLERPLEARLIHLADIWSDPAQAETNPFADMPTDGPFPVAAAALPEIAALSGRPAEEVQEGLFWGCEAHRRAVFARRLARACAAVPADRRTSAETQALLIDQAVQARLTAPDLSGPLDRVNNGQSALILHVHAGLSNIMASGFTVPDVPLSVVAASPDRAGGPEGHVALMSPEATAQAAALSVLMKDHPRIVRAFIDVPVAETVPAQIEDRTVGLAAQVFDIAADGTAATYFSRTVWDGQSFTSTMEQGPNALDYSDVAAFKADLVAFVAAQIMAIIEGNPADMAPDGGFWIGLRQR